MKNFTIPKIILRSFFKKIIFHQDKQMVQIIKLKKVYSVLFHCVFTKINHVHLRNLPDVINKRRTKIGGWSMVGHVPLGAVPVMQVR